MAKDNRIAIIVEGESFENKIINALRKAFFQESDWTVSYTVLSLPAAKNLYMLWKDVQNDDCIDLIEVVRESSDESSKKLEGLCRDDFSELYLFFDYDSQQTNLPKGVEPTSALLEMLKTFNNETELGKLYISYPMAEALRDFKQGSCESFSGNCYISHSTKNYKNISGYGNKMGQFNKYTDNIWRDVLNCYLGRISCLLSKNKIVSLAEARTITPEELFKLQIAHSYNNEYRELIISAFPEFIIDYFEEQHISEYIGKRDFDYRNCFCR